MKKLGIVVTDENDWTANALIQEAGKRGFETCCPDLGKLRTSIGKRIEHITDGVNLSELDAIIIRDMGQGKNDGHIFRFDVLQELEKNGTLMINPPSAIQNAANKFHTSCLLSDAGIPTPGTFATQEIEPAMDMIEKLGDVVVKPIFGYKGIGIKRIQNMAVINPDGSPDQTETYDFVSSYIEEKGILYIQEFVENPGQDIRAFVVNNVVIGAIYRKAPEGSWLNNLSQGGTSQECKLTAEQERICLQAARAVGAVYAGVDLIEGENGCYILEVNATPSGAGIYKSLNVNVAEHIIDTIENML
ncbi:MAG: tetrahydromethanopterin:alpha-L-glutamate ligase [Methanolobus sp.]